jgi:acyl-CoA thioesterase-1
MEASLNRFVQLAYGAGRAVRNLGAAIVIAGAAQAEPVTVAALGDSLTQGYGLLPDEGFVPQLEGWLREAGADVTVVNAGVSGDTTAGGLARAAWTLTPEVDAVIVALGGNDLLRGIDPAESEGNLRGILEAAEAAGVAALLVGMEAPSNYGPEYKAAFDGMYVELAEEFGVPLYPAFFQGLLVGSDMESARADFMQGDGIHPNPEGVARIVSDMGPAVLALVQGLE